ncbi:jg4238, partial [Pararge aegeria aegeria]
ATSPVAPPNANTGRSQTKSEKRSGNTLYQELAFHDTEANINEVDDGADFTGNCITIMTHSGGATSHRFLEVKTSSGQLSSFWVNKDRETRDLDTTRI